MIAAVSYMPRSHQDAYLLGFPFLLVYLCLPPQEV